MQPNRKHTTHFLHEKEEPYNKSSSHEVSQPTIHSESVPSTLNTTEDDEEVSFPKTARQPAGETVRNKEIETIKQYQHKVIHLKAF